MNFKPQFFIPSVRGITQAFKWLKKENKHGTRTVTDRNSENLCTLLFLLLDGGALRWTVRLYTLEPGHTVKQKRN